MLGRSYLGRVNSIVCTRGGTETLRCCATKCNAKKAGVDNTDLASGEDSIPSKKEREQKYALSASVSTLSGTGALANNCL